MENTLFWRLTKRKGWNLSTQNAMCDIQTNAHIRRFNFLKICTMYMGKFNTRLKELKGKSCGHAVT